MVPLKLIITIVSLILLVNIATFYFFNSEDHLQANHQQFIQQVPSPPSSKKGDDLDEIKNLDKLLELTGSEDSTNSEDESSEDVELSEDSEDSEDPEDLEDSEDPEHLEDPEPVDKLDESESDSPLSGEDEKDVGDDENSEDDESSEDTYNDGAEQSTGSNSASEKNDSEDEENIEISESEDPDEFSQPQHIEKAQSEAWLAKNPKDYFDAQSISDKFVNPKLALKLLTELDVDSTLDKSFLNNEYEFKKHYRKSKKFNNDYCTEHRGYIVEHPELVFEGKNVFTDYWVGETRKKVLPEFGAVDLIKKKNRIKGVQTDLRLDINIYFNFELWFYKRQVGKQFSCITQISNHIPGHQKIYYKDQVGEALIQYARGYDTRPDCFGFTKYFPKTWVLRHKDQCEEFFAELNSELYQKLKAERNIVYFRKIGNNVHQGRGVFPVNDEEEQKIRAKYKNGKSCGEIQNNNLIQYNVHNTVLVQKRKIGFRMFMLVASSNPIIAFYHDGYARLSVNEYHTDSQSASTFVTNIHLNVQQAAKGTSMEGLTEMEIQDMTFWLLKDVQDYFYNNKMISDPNWLNNTLKNDFKKVMIHLIRMSQDGFYRQSSVYELYGLDFVMDENLDLWYIEGNTKPQIRGVIPRSQKLLNKMVYDSLEIVFSLLKSRMKRIVNYINFLTKEVAEDGGEIRNIKQRREEFKIISRNTFDAEFPLSADNGFEKIIDENYSGTKRYAGLIREDCLEN